MIKFEHTSVMNFENAFRGMRNPLNSWDKSDSFTCNNVCEKCPHYYIKSSEVGVYESCSLNKLTDFVIGQNDMTRAQNLVKAGTDHRKFLRQIFVSVDIVAPLYWWKEMDQYRVAVVSNSCSTMHKIHAKEFTSDDFSHEHLIDESLSEIEPGVVNTFNLQANGILDILISVLNATRVMYLKTNDKRYWWQMIQLLPTSYNQKRTVTLNYETLRNIYNSRRNHKLDEWSVGFMNWIDTLPYAEELIKYTGKGENVA